MPDSSQVYFMELGSEVYIANAAVLAQPSAHLRRAVAPVSSQCWRSLWCSRIIFSGSDVLSSERNIPVIDGSNTFGM